MNKLAIAIAVPALLLPLRYVGALPQDPVSADHAAVERAVQDYVEAIYEVKPELIERSVHPALVKRGSYRPADAAEYRMPSIMTYEQLHELAGYWNADDQRGADLAFSIDVLDVLDVSASAKLTADWGIDYMHLEKRDCAWKIVHVLWQSHPRDRG